MKKTKFAAKPDRTVLFWYEQQQKKMRAAIQAKNHKEVIKIGLNIVNRPNFTPPPVCYLALGKAYANELAALDSDKEADEEYLKECQINVYKWLTKARQAGAQLGCDDIINIGVCGCTPHVHKWLATGRLVEETLANIEQGIYPPQSDETMYQLYKTATICEQNIGDNLKAFEMLHRAFLLIKDEEKRRRAYSDLLFFTLFLEFSGEDLYEMHRVYDTLFTGVKPYCHNLPEIVAELKATGRRIRIGYISPDCRHHVARFFWYGLLLYADRQRFEVFMYSLTPKKDAMTKQISETVEHFADVAKMSLAETAAKIYEDGIDILVDLAGHTGDSGLPVLAYKPAPVQMSGIGYLATTGLKAVDYYITDKIVDPPGLHENQFTEKLLYLTSQFSAFEGIAEERPLADCAPCAKKGYVTFGVFNRYDKVTDKMLAVWARILDAVPDSRLMLKASVYKDEDLVAAAKERFARCGVPAERCDFEPSSRDYLPRYSEVDIALDTYPYTGGGTTVDAIYMGVPVVSLYGERRNTRFSLGILVNVGLNSLAVDTPEKYVDVAVTLAKNLDTLNIFRSKLRAMMQNSVVGRPDLYTKELEEKYLEVLGLL